MLPELQTKFVESARTNQLGLLEDDLVHDAQISVSDCLAIYHNNVVGSLVDVLGDSYSATRNIVGDEFFVQMAHAFISEQLPQSGNVNEYGSNFSAFIDNYELVQNLPYLSDVARFEWCWNEIYLAPDQPALSAEELQRIAPEDYSALTFSFRDSAQLFASDYPVDAIWRFAESGGEGAAPDPNNDGVFLLLFRREMQVQILPLTRSEYLMLCALFMGNRLEDAYAAVIAEAQDFNIVKFLTKFLSLRIFKGENHA